ncbi:MAG TPA: primosomal protein N' [Solirubrobacteraceae bacterium]|nr:primosomal protein N' [Solirubrobacteraceae bacterium]
MPAVARVEPLTTARALRGPFDYLRPDGVGVGALLRVPFGSREVTGVVVALAEDSELARERLATPLEVLQRSLPPDLVALAEWMAREYCSTFARAAGLMLPPAGTRERSVLWAEGTGHEESARLTDRQRTLLASLPRFAGDDLPALRRLERRGLARIAPRARRRHILHVAVGARAGSDPPPLTRAQSQALAEVEAAVAAGEHAALLVHGVTGSGKTEVYLRAAAAALERGRGAIVLVPEIALTPQTVARFAARFGDTVAVTHSGLSDGERHDEWLRLRRGEARVCVGPRSAVFAPVADLGLVVVDEEHEASYKHEGDPRYDARAVAARRAQQAGAVLLAGSATPRPESVHALRRLRLPERVDDRPLPAVELVDMRGASGAALHPRTLHALADEPKAVVLLNRRGWSNFLECRSCGRGWPCPHCEVALVLHRAAGTVACHHCGHRERVPRACPDCASVSLARHGTGTERLEQELGQLGLAVFRLDSDAGPARPVLAAFEAADRGVLLGTQVVAKGHDFPDVSLGVVVDADATLRFPDFRAEERTFALITQLAGRAGRGGQGRVLVQTLDPSAAAVVAAAAHDADGFLAGELARRETLRYPPFSSLIRVVCSARADAPGAAALAAGAVREAMGEIAGAQVLGPAPLFRLRGRERSQLMVKAADRARAIAAVGGAVARVAAGRAHRAAALSVDVDPQ